MESETNETSVHFSICLCECVPTSIGRPKGLTNADVPVTVLDQLLLERVGQRTRIALEMIAVLLLFTVVLVADAHTTAVGRRCMRLHASLSSRRKLATSVARSVPLASDWELCWKDTCLFIHL